jgi:hypothetical protein
MKIYVTKHALTRGIEEYGDAEIDETRAHVDGRELGMHFALYFHGNEWHKTKAEAIARANLMRDQKIASLRKQIAKLESLTFGE